MNTKRWMITVGAILFLVSVLGIPSSWKITVMAIIGAAFIAYGLLKDKIVSILSKRSNSDFE